MPEYSSFMTLFFLNTKWDRSYRTIFQLSPIHNNCNMTQSSMEYNKSGVKFSLKAQESYWSTSRFFRWLHYKGWPFHLVHLVKWEKKKYLNGVETQSKHCFRLWTFIYIYYVHEFSLRNEQTSPKLALVSITTFYTQSQ